MVLSRFEKLPLSQAKFDLLQSIVSFLAKTSNMDIVKRGVDDVATFRDAIPEAFRSQTDGPINGFLKDLATKKTTAGLKDQADYITSKLPEADKKGLPPTPKRILKNIPKNIRQLKDGFFY